MNESQFTVLNENGEEIVCDILFTFDSDETGHSYVAYTDNSVDENGSLHVFASIYDPTGVDKKLTPIESEREWKVIDTILETLKETIDEKQKELNQEEVNE